MAERVKVAVRVRPFNEREKKRNAKLVIDMKGNLTYISDPNNKSNKKDFAFDYSYWSHDGFKEEKNGYLSPESAAYADQKKVFDDLGKGVLENAWSGFNCSLFAYGQTGSGKSYSMVGYGNNKGIVPIVCEKLFQEIEGKREKAKDSEYQVVFSMIEIYNEQARDLLNPASFKVKGGLKVRENPTKGLFFVDGLKELPVNSYQSIESKMTEGTKNRTVASTNMNATSSRAHTVIGIKFTQKTPNASGQSMTRVSVINLVDLAGSERANSTGAEGDRLKEGASINQSLSNLGNCINALAENKKNIPFRNSALTKLLKNALGGNSKTVMIAALSPADINYDETLSTLRFADRAKSIKTKAVINESPTDKLIRELKEENERLKKMVEGKGGVPAGVENKEEYENMQRELEANKKEIEDMEKSYQEKLAAIEAAAKEQAKEAAADKKKSEQRKVMPHLWNLNEDPALTGIVCHFTPQGDSKIGNNKGKNPDIILSGMGMLPEHAVISNSKDQKIILKPCAGAKICLNGNEIKDKKELHHNDRVQFGANMLFVFHHPKDYTALAKKKKVPPEPTFEQARDEISQNSGINKILDDKMDQMLQQDLMEIWPMLNEANMMSEELDKQVKFEIALIAPQAVGKKSGRTEIKVKVKDLPTGNEFMWDKNTFTNRKYMMQEMYNNYIDGDADWDKPKNEDPFWEDPNNPYLIGTAHVHMMAVAYNFHTDETFLITDYRGIDQGQLSCKLLITSKNGKVLSDKELDEIAIEDPSRDLVGCCLNFKLEIPCVRGINKKYSQVYCAYQFYIDDKKEQTREVGGTINPDFNFSKAYAFDPATPQLVQYLEQETLVIEVWGRQKSSDGNNSGLSTRELSLKDRKGAAAKATGKGKGGARASSKSNIEAMTYKRRMERAEQKLRKLANIVEDAKSKNAKDIDISKIEEVIMAGYKFKAAANVVKQVLKAKNNNMGTATSQACSLQ
ncbi:DgyrCDS12576 [Dimorphilus gyrociliatus]|uniref:Kinesin-like protein n=2 Tax=Dimorphilus gyrociliatus TaxID=2664684 RepID=A0A7I8W6W2_9ANNE|nr:DgyrCDS12576 [Dimorphilus gyrociliatus]